MIQGNNQTITSLQNPSVKQATGLHLKKNRDEESVFLVEGEIPCRDALANGWECVTLFASYIFNDKTTLVTREILEKISKKSNPQDVIGIFRQKKNTEPEPSEFSLALENIRDPGNLGTILRTAHAVNVKNVVLLGECCDPYAPETIRASMGSFAFMTLSVMNYESFFTWQKKNQLHLIGTDVAQAGDYREIDYMKSILVMGNEQKGLSVTVKDRCDALVKIPMPGGTESLNLAVATALLLYESQRNLL